ncbi:MAG TPA: helix-turn-helix domain-containing protein [Pseudonocardia sp.]|nr:helix-turn-helix domain-containing protein [Pseudonocardia sp.]
MPTRTGITRQALLEATAELIYQRGITATGVDLIAERAGVTKRTLYQHFRSKDDLVAASLSERGEVALELFGRAAASRARRTGQPAVLALFDVIERLLAGPMPAGCALLNASLELADPDHPARRAAREKLTARNELVARLLREAGVDDAELAGELALLVDGAFATGGAHRDPSAAARAKRAAAHLIDRYRATAPRTPRAPS